MKKRLPFKIGIYNLSLLLLSILSSSTLKAQDWIITLCSGGPPALTTSNLYGPMYSVTTANATSRTACIYPAAQLAGISGATLTDLYFHKGTTTAAMLGTPNFKIYLKEVSNADWGTGALTWATEIAGATLVYDNNPAATIGTAMGWKEFNLISNFVYSGTQNLAVFMEYNNTVASTAIPWSYEYTGPCSTNSNATKYTNNTTGTLPLTLATGNLRRPYIAFDTLVGVDNNIGVDSLLAPVGNFCSGLEEVAVRVANFGTNDVNSFGLHWSVNGVNQTPISNTSLLNSIYTSPSFVDISLGNLTFPYGQNTELKFWTVSPNGVTDADQLNDTLSVTISPPTEGVTVEITPEDTIICTGSVLTLDAGVQPTGAIYVWNTGALTRTIDVDESGTYIVQVQSLGGCIDEDTVNVTFAPPPAAQSILITPTSSNSFVFNLFAEQHVDEYTWNYGDGTPEEMGAPPKSHTYDEPGTYTVTCTLANSCGESVVSRPVSATVTSVGDLEMLNNSIKVFPNPAKDKVSITMAGNIVIEHITVCNLLGQKIFSTPVLGSSYQLNTSELPNGMYSMVVNTSKGSLTKKLQILK